MDLTNVSEMFKGGLAGGLIGAIIAIGIAIALFLFIIFYVYFAYTWMTIAKKRKYKRPWLAWIPFANGAMILELGGFHWAWIFLAVVPIFGWIALMVLITIATWKIFEQLNYPGWLSLAMFVDIIPGIRGLGIIAYGIVLGIVAWRKR